MTNLPKCLMLRTWWFYIFKADNKYKERQFLKFKNFVFKINSFIYRINIKVMHNIVYLNMLCKLITHHNIAFSGAFANVIILWFDSYLFAADMATWFIS